MNKQKKKIIFILAMTFVLNIMFSCITAVGFNPNNDTDEETDKEYTVKLLDLQFNTAIALSLDEFAITDTPLSLIGSMQINHKKDSNVEILENEPTLKMINEEGESVGTTCIYQYEDTDTYYFDIYDLNINNIEQYKLLVSFTDNYGKEVEKYATYNGSMFISSHPDGTMTYKSINNLAIMEFNLDTLDIIKGDLSKDGIVDSADAAIALNIFKYDNATGDDLARGDMDGNGLIDSADAAMILNAFKYQI